MTLRAFLAKQSHPGFLAAQPPENQQIQ